MRRASSPAALIVRFGVERITGIGLALIALAAVIGIAGITVAHFWTALVLLGARLEFRLHRRHHHGDRSAIGRSERNKVQAFNDFLIFGSMALSSFSSGQLLEYLGWTAINEVIFPTVFVAGALLVWLACASAAVAA